MDSLLKININKLQKKEPLNTLRKKVWIKVATAALNAKSPKKAGYALECLLAKSTDNRTKSDYLEKDIPSLFRRLDSNQSPLTIHVDSLSYLIAHATNGGYKTEKLLLSAFYDGPNDLWWCFYLPSLYRDKAMLGRNMPSPSPIHEYESGYNYQFILESYKKSSNIQPSIKNSALETQKNHINQQFFHKTLWGEFRQPIMSLMASMDYFISSYSCHSLQETAYLHTDISYDDRAKDQLLFDDCLDRAVTQLVQTVERMNFNLWSISPQEIAHIAWEQAWHYASVVYPTDAPIIRRELKEISTYPDEPIAYKKIIIDYSRLKTGHKGHPIINVEIAKQMRRNGCTLKEIGNRFGVTAEAVRKAILK